MSAWGAIGVDAEIDGDVVGQLIVGDHNVVITAEGSTVLVRNVPEPQVKRRSRPVRGLAPPPGGVLLGRDEELARLAAWLDEGLPVQVHGPRGVGKTALLRTFAAERKRSGFDVVFMSAAGLGIEDLVQGLFQIFYDVLDYRPSPARLHRLMGSVRGLVVIDDYEGAAEDLRNLLDVLRSADVVFASVEKIDLDEARSLALGGLPEDAAMELVRSELGRNLGDEELEPARRLWQDTAGYPGSLLQTLAGLRGTETMPAFPNPQDVVRSRLAELSETARTALAALRALPDVTVPLHLLGALTGVDHDEAVAELAQARLIAITDSGTTLAVDPSLLDDAVPDPASYVTALSAWARGADIGDIADAAPIIIKVLTAAVREGLHAPAVDLARIVAPMLARALKWGSWQRVLTLGKEASAHLGSADDIAYFTHEDQTRRRSTLSVGAALGSAFGQSAGAGAAVAVSGGIAPLRVIPHMLEFFRRTSRSGPPLAAGGPAHSIRRSLLDGFMSLFDPAALLHRRRRDRRSPLDPATARLAGKYLELGPAGTPGAANPRPGGDTE